MLRTLPLIFLSLCLISLAMYSDEHVLFIVAILLYLAFFSIGMSSTPWTVNSEIYPMHLVGTAVSLATATNWLSNFTVSSLFLTSMESDGGKIWTWLILAAFAVAAFIFILLMLPETAG